jgi:hypothetical protein
LQLAYVPRPVLLSRPEKIPAVCSWNYENGWNSGLDIKAPSS